MKLLDNLYAYPWQGNDNNCNTCVFSGVLPGGRHVVVDPGHLITPYYREPGLQRLLERMSEDGMSASAIGLVLLTHGHPDHSESAVALREEYKAAVAIHESDYSAYRAMGGKADFFLDEGSLEFESGAALEIVHSPGHTPGHVTIYWPARRVLIAGDCIFYRSTGRADLPGGSARMLSRTVERLSQLDIEHLLCGHPYGHTGIISGREEVQNNFRFIRNMFY